MLSRGIANSRCKDYYDLYIIRKTQVELINLTTLKVAYKQTCLHRNFSISKEEAERLIYEVKQNQSIMTRWGAFCKKVKYAEGLSLNDVVEVVIERIEECIG